MHFMDSLSLHNRKNRTNSNRLRMVDPEVRGEVQYTSLPPLPANTSKNLHLQSLSLAVFLICPNFHELGVRHTICLKPVVALTRWASDDVITASTIQPALTTYISRCSLCTIFIPFIQSECKIIFFASTGYCSLVLT